MRRRRSTKTRRRWCLTRRRWTMQREDGRSSETSQHSHYIWDLTFDKQGRLYIADRRAGGGVRVDVSKPGAQPEIFFKSDEQHIRSLAWDAKGNLIAGSDGSGLVYRIDAQGKGYVLFEAPRREITVGCGRDGRNDLRSECGRQEPQSAAAAAGAGTGQHHDHDRAAGLAAGGKCEFVCAGGHRNLRAERGAGAAQGVVEQRTILCMRSMRSETACWR